MRRGLDLLLVLLSITALMVVVRTALRSRTDAPVRVPTVIERVAEAGGGPIEVEAPQPVSPVGAGPVMAGPDGPVPGAGATDGAGDGLPPLPTPAEVLERIALDEVRDEPARHRALATLVNDHATTASAGRVAVRAIEVFRGLGWAFEERNALSIVLLGSLLDPAEGVAAAGRIDALNDRLILSPGPNPDALDHDVVPGDALSRISRRYGVPLAILRRANAIPPDSDLIRVGERLKVQRGPWRIVVEKGGYTLMLTVAGRYLRRYAVGIGRDGRTPAGQYTLRNKVVDPTWYTGGRAIPPGSPEHTIGTRWLGLSDDRTTGLGIHGTSDPDSVGQAVSAGCVRMRNEDVEDLYDLVPLGTVVEIQD